ncbi:hypothetical protein, partial [Salmonella enterica]|uniref:hypothetical protein n=1 Tax=Salmonella enterica TaxID=28901 RepID=UPI003297ABA7
SAECVAARARAREQKLMPFDTPPTIEDASYRKKLLASMIGTKFRPAMLDRCLVEGTWTTRFVG